MASGEDRKQDGRTLMISHIVDNMYICTFDFNALYRNSQSLAATSSIAQTGAGQHSPAPSVVLCGDNSKHTGCPVSVGHCYSCCVCIQMEVWAVGEK